MAVSAVAPLFRTLGRLFLDIARRRERAKPANLVVSHGPRSCMLPEWIWADRASDVEVQAGQRSAVQLIGRVEADRKPLIE